MAPAARYAASWLTALASLASTASASTIPAPKPLEFGPSEAAARQNAFAIFNSIHSAMRQWGSSLHHNGMSVFLATVPAGVILHHGTSSPNSPPGPEWLAFEIEHAEGFARPRMHPPTVFPPPPETPPFAVDHHHPHHNERQSQQRPLNYGADDDDRSHGYLHIYRTTQPLHLLYVDGTSAGNTIQGTLDTQDILLRANRNASLWDEFTRARELCSLIRSWGLHGLLRMEAGFEVVKCAPFVHGLEMVGGRARQRPGDAGWGTGGARAVQTWEFARAVARRYGGIGGGRVQVDWGSMVSGYFYEVDLGVGDEQQGEQDGKRGEGKGLPRLVGVEDEELEGIRKRVGEVMTARTGAAEEGGKPVVDWQGVADLVVDRYAERLRYIAETVVSALGIQGEVNSLLNTHIDYAVEDEERRLREARERCATHYTLTVVPQTQEDRLILAAVETVTGAICDALFEVRKVLVEDAEGDDGSLGAARKIVRELMTKLKWSKFKECGGCRHDEMCFVPMWPFGDKESFERPNCRNVSSLQNGWIENSYWEPTLRVIRDPDPKEEL